MNVAASRVAPLGVSARSVGTLNGRRRSCLKVPDKGLFRHTSCSSGTPRAAPVDRRNVCTLDNGSLVAPKEVAD
ncbi:hypothetical protein MTO96_011734 [Rhipicephalus appendiculatus]